jgi:hypothetical protein
VRSYRKSITAMRIEYRRFISCPPSIREACARSLQQCACAVPVFLSLLALLSRGPGPRYDVRAFRAPSAGISRPHDPC